MRSATFGFFGLKYCLSIVLFLLSLVYTDIHAQVAYIQTDTATMLGILLVDKGNLQNSAYCTVKTTRASKRLTPYEINEYGFPDGRVYIAKTIYYNGDLRRVFLEQLSMGSFAVYYYHSKEGKTFFIEKEGGEIHELPRKDEGGTSFRTELWNYTSDFPEGMNAVQDVQYKRDAMAEFFSRYKSRAHRPFPHVRYGVTLEYGLTVLDLQVGNTIMASSGPMIDGGFSAGVFTDIPLLLSDFSLNAGINISKRVHSFGWTSGIDNEDFYAKSTSVAIPLLIRYSWPSNKVRPFVNAGGLAMINMNNSNTLYRTTFYDNTINLEIDRTAYISEFYKGFSTGAGVEYRLNGGGSVFTEVRLSMLRSSEKLMKMNLLNLTLGYSF